MGTEIDTGHSNPTLLSVLNVHTVEDKIWSTMWGVKGIIDVTVDVAAAESQHQPGIMQR